MRAFAEISMARVYVDMRTQLCEFPMESHYENFQIAKQCEAVRGVHAVWSLWEASVDLFDDLPES